MTSSRLLLTAFIPFLIAVGAPISRAADPADPPADEHVVVTATRLPDQESELRDLPAAVTVVTREQIEASGARTIQEALARETGVVAYDQVGNGVQYVLDWRGFSSGTGCAVFLDGARINDPRNNTAALESVPLDAVERIEITRGSAAALTGGGSESAVVQIFTRSPAETRARISLAAGSDAARRLGGDFAGSFGRVELQASAALDRSDGFRENAVTDQKRYTASAGYGLGSGRRLLLSFAGSQSGFGTPGSLTEAEFDVDPYAAPYNQLDYSQARASQLALTFRGPLLGAVSLTANAFWRSKRDESLTTGRAATQFGGFVLDAEGSAAGATAQVTHDASGRGTRNRLAAGVEWLDGSTGSLGYFTSPSNPGTVTSDSPDSDNTAESRGAAFFVQDTWTPSPQFVVHVGGRFDSNLVRYEETIPDPTVRDERTFSKTSFRGGVTWRPAGSVDAYASYGEAFLPPTAEQLFAFPLFGSNKDLEAETSRALEAGVRLRRGRVEVDGAVFRIGTYDEIVFDPTPVPGNPYGRNVNAGRTTREGIEIALRARLARALDGYVRGTLTRAAFANGPTDGKSVPLVPRQRLSLGLDARLAGGLGLRGDFLYVGSQVLLNDDANAQAPLSAYAVLDLRGTWTARARRTGAKRGAWTLFAEVRNALDRKYATRGIYAFDFVALENTVFVTPAPGRRLYGGVTWAY